MDKLDRLLVMIADSQSRIENIKKDLVSLKSKQEEQDQRIKKLYQRLNINDAPVSEPTTQQVKQNNTRTQKIHVCLVII